MRLCGNSSCLSSQSIVKEDISIQEIASSLFHEAAFNSLSPYSTTYSSPLTDHTNTQVPTLPLAATRRPTLKQSPIPTQAPDMRPSDHIQPPSSPKPSDRTEHPIYERELVPLKLYEYSPQVESSLPFACKERTKYLKQFTLDVRLPLLVDVIASSINNATHILILFNLAHLNITTINEEKHNDFVLTFDGKEYPNLFKGEISWNAYLMLRFVIPYVSPSPLTAISVTLTDRLHNRIYKNIQTCIQPANKPESDLFICAYVSPYNSVLEVLQWATYYRLQHVNKIIFYYGIPYPALQAALADWEREGFVEFVDWTWPTTGILKRSQRENQQTQVMSCFYRYRIYTNYMIFCDVDEYIHTNMTSYRLDHAVQKLFTRFDKYNVVTVVLILWTQT